MRSIGICLRYPAVIRSSSACGAFCLSSVYCEIRERNCHKDHHQADHDQHFNQGEALASVFVACCHYQSLYLVPSSTVPSDFVNTSKTFCPPQESEAGSSCMERRPQS